MLFSFFSECAVFTWTNLLVVVAELDGAESEVVTYKTFTLSP